MIVSVIEESFILFFPFQSLLLNARIVQVNAITLGFTTVEGVKIGTLSMTSVVLKQGNKDFISFSFAPKVWNLTNCRLKTNHIGHQGYLNVVTVSPDGSLCASGGKDGMAMLWDLNEGKHLYTLEGGDIINSLCFSPNRYWLCAAVGPTIKIWVSLNSG